VTPAPMETAAAPPPPAKLASAAVSCESPPPIPKRVLLGYPVADLGDLSRERPDTGGFDTQGVVLRQFEPAPCPPGATCKPQHPSHIILASEVSDEDRAIFLETPKPKAFAIGTRIRVSVVFCGDRGSSSLAHGQLLAAAPLSS
jgi:hypothetical protein